MERIPPEPGDTPGSLARHYLAQRGIASATIETFKIHIDTEPTSTRFKDRLGFRALLEGRLDNLAKEVIWFPCCDSAGNTVSWIAKPLPSVGSAKFLNRQGGAFPFIPSETWAAASKSHKPLVIAEGPVLGDPTTCDMSSSPDKNAWRRAITKQKKKGFTFAEVLALERGYKAWHPQYVRTKQSESGKNVGQKNLRKNS